VHENYQNLLILVVMGGMGKQEQCNTECQNFYWVSGPVSKTTCDGDKWNC